MRNWCREVGHEFFLRLWFELFLLFFFLFVPVFFFFCSVLLFVKRVKFREGEFKFRVLFLVQHYLIMNLCRYNMQIRKFVCHLWGFTISDEGKKKESRKNE